MKRQTNGIVGVSDGKVHEYKIGDVTYFFLQNLSAALKPICVTVYKERWSAISYL